MQIRIKRIDKELALPKHHTAGAAAFDLYVRETTTVPARSIARVPLNNVIATPPGYFLMIAARSSLHKRGLMMGNGVGIIDPDFAGDTDEISGVLYNFTDAPIVVEKGERVIQGVFIKTSEWRWEETETMPHKDRGGFGTTGK